MHALIYETEGKPLIYKEIKDPAPGGNEVLVDLKAAALNHRDVYITQGLYPGIKTPIILGSDGAGMVDGQEVIINPAMDWGPDPRAQGKDFHILGLPQNGTMAQRVAVPSDNVVEKPAHLSWEQAAALPLGGLTAYRALFTQGQCQAGQRVLISGIGGGVALFAFQFALAAGADVYITSGSPVKLERATEMGAKGGANYQTDQWHKDLLKQGGGFDVIIDSAGGPGFINLVKAVNPGGRIVMYGGTRGKIDGLSPQILFWKQASIIGSTMGTAEEFVQMVDFVDRHKIEPVVDQIYDLKDGQQAFDRMAAGAQFGKLVLRID
jgi:NADPH:quinone reductase-like Zn-dependent oxidoreductase